jgi:hypothetical protein
MNTLRMIWRGIGVLGWCVASTGCGQQAGEEQVSEQVSALNAAGKRVFGFENLADWSVNGGTATLDDVHDEGAHALHVVSTGAFQVTSATVSSPVDATALLAFDLIVPHLQSPNWNGQAQIILNSPSRGINNVALTARAFPFPFTVFQRIQFAVPSAVLTKLAGSFSDLRVTIAISGAAGAYSLDNLRFITAAEGGTPVASIKTRGVLDFEDPNLWVSYAPAVLASSTRSVSGGHSLAVSKIGWTRLDSAPVPTPGRAAPFIAFNLVVPSPQPNGWRGSVDLLVSMPSAGLTDVTVGHQDLANLPLGTFQRIVFPVPANVQTALAGSHLDARFSLVLNVPTGTPGTYLLDNLRLRADATAGSDPELPALGPFLTSVRASAHDQPAQPAPALGGSGAAAVQSVRDFVTWAAQSRSSQVAGARKLIHAASNNADVAQALIAEANATSTDIGRPVMALSILGELKNTLGEDYFLQLVDRALPPGAPDAAPVATMTTLQLKAVDGLGFMKSARSKAKLLNLAAQHPARAVRIEAIRSYLDNYGSAGRAALAAVVSASEAPFIDGFYHRSELKETMTYDQKLAAFVTAHPEAANPGGH